MSLYSPSRSAGFTLVELFVGVSLSMMVMAAVLSSYVFVARSYARTIGLGLPNEPTLGTQDRRTLAAFAQDVQMASAISSPTSSEITLAVPHRTGGTKNITYYYNDTATAASVYGVTVPANALARIDRNTSTALTLHTSLLTCTFIYYDAFANPYMTYADYAIGIKQISLALTAQAGNPATNTQTKAYSVTSPRHIFRNKSLLP